MGPINPKLHIEMTFTEEESELIYWRDDEQGLCRRKARYALQKCHDQTEAMVCELYQKVIWLDPQNQASCSKDPDMQLNKESWSLINIQNQEIQLVLPLGSESIIFRFKHTERADK